MKIKRQKNCKIHYNYNNQEKDKCKDAEQTSKTQNMGGAKNVARIHLNLSD